MRISDWSSDVCSSDLRDIRADLLGDQPVILGVVHIMEDLGRAQQRLGGDAPPVEADAAQILTLDDRGLQAELRRAARRDIAAGARAENNDVISVNHDILLQRTSPPDRKNGV